MSGLLISVITITLNEATNLSITIQKAREASQTPKAWGGIPPGGAEQKKAEYYKGKEVKGRK